MSKRAHVIPLESPSRIRGWVSDQLFGLVAADLGGGKLVKQEDTDILLYEDEVKLPWRVTSRSTQQCSLFSAKPLEPCASIYFPRCWVARCVQSCHVHQFVCGRREMGCPAHGSDVPIVLGNDAVHSGS